MESWVQSWRPRANAFCDFSTNCLKFKVLRLPGKSESRSYGLLHLSRKIILANLTIWCSKMHPLSGNQRPDLLTSLVNMSLALRLPLEMHLCESFSNVPCLPSFWKTYKTLTFSSLQGAQSLAPGTRNDIWMSKSGPSLNFEMCFAPKRRALFERLNFEEWSEHVVFFNALTWKCGSRNNSVHFFNISTSKSGLGMQCF